MAAPFPMEDVITERWLHTESVCRYYRRGAHEVRALDRVDLDIEQGDFVSVVGSSGSGKSTLLNLLAGLDRPTSGDIYVGSQSFGSMTPKELSKYRAHRVGMVFQTFNLIPHLTAQANVELALFFNNTPARQRQSRAAGMLSRLGLADRLDHRPADLSGGEQQRVAIARALVKNPDILFADEPSGNLDEENTNEIAALLKDLNGQGLTIVMVTHDRALAGQVSNRIVRLHYGRIADPDPTAEAE